MARQRLRPAKADGELGDLQIIEEAEAFRLAAFQKHAEGAARAKAVAIIDVLLARILDVTKIAEARHLGVAFQESADLGGVLTGALHPQLDRFETAQEHPCGVGIDNAAHRVPERAHRIHPRLRPGNTACYQIGVSADIFGQRIGHDIRAMLQRALPQGPEEGVVDGDRAGVLLCATACCLSAKVRVACCLYRFDIDQRIGGVAGAFEVDHRHLAAVFTRLFLGAFQHLVQFFAGRACGEIDIGDAKFRQHLGDETLGRGIERARMHDHVALADIGHHQDADCGHAAAECQRVLCPVPDGEAIFEDLLVRPIEARIDKAFCSAGPFASDAFEMAFARSRAFEGEG